MRLSDAGVEVERGDGSVGLEERDQGIMAPLGVQAVASTSAKPRSSPAATALAARLREVLSIGFADGTYDDLFYVADVEEHTDRR